MFYVRKTSIENHVARSFIVVYLIKCFQRLKGRSASSASLREGKKWYHPHWASSGEHRARLRTYSRAVKSICRTPMIQRLRFQPFTIFPAWDDNQRVCGKGYTRVIPALECKPFFLWRGFCNDIFCGVTVFGWTWPGSVGKPWRGEKSIFYRETRKLAGRVKQIFSESANGIYFFRTITVFCASDCLTFPNKVPLQDDSGNPNGLDLSTVLRCAESKAAAKAPKKVQPLLENLQPL